MRLPLAAMLAGWALLRRLGGIGLIIVGIAGDSLVPLPGLLDALTVVLAASHGDNWWPYYAAMAATGSVMGGYLGYRIARKGGKETLEKKLSPRKVQKVYSAFERNGFGAIFVPALLPPPLPLMPFVMAAGALNYPTRRFLLALASGRLLRFSLVAYLGAIYGQRVFAFLGAYYRPILIVLVTGAIAGALALAAFLYRRRTRMRQQESGAASDDAPRRAA